MEATVRLVAVALCWVLASTAEAQQSPSEVSPGQVAFFKNQLEAACRDVGREEAKDPPEVIRAYCACVLNTLSSNLTNEGWQKYYFYVTRRLKAEEEQLLAPHWAKIQACRPRP